MTYREIIWKLLIIFVLIYLSVFLGSQSGWDYYNYEKIYNWQLRSDDILDRFEYLYAFIFYIFTREVSFEFFRGFEYFLSYLSYWLGLNIVYQKQKNKNILSFLTVLYFFDAFWGARQGLAIGIYFYFQSFAPLIAVALSLGIHTGVGLVGCILILLQKINLKSPDLRSILIFLVFSALASIFIVSLAHPMLIAALTGESYAVTSQSLIYKIFKVFELLLPLIFVWYIRKTKYLTNLLFLVLILGSIILIFPFLEVLVGRLFAIIKILIFPVIILSLLESINGKNRNYFIIGFFFITTSKFCVELLSENLSDFMYS